MTDTHTSTQSATPRHFWFVSIVSLLWNAVGGYDWLMTHFENEAYMSRFTQEQLDYFYGFPGWVEFFWFVAVWGSVVGSILLIMKRRLSVQVFLISLVSALVTTFHNFVLTDGMEIMGGSEAVIFSTFIILVAIGLYFYARTMSRKGILK